MKRIIKYLLTAAIFLFPLMSKAQEAETFSSLKYVGQGGLGFRGLLEAPSAAEEIKLAAAAAQGKAQETTMWEWIEQSLAQFTQHMQALGSEMSSIENIYSGIKEGTDIANQVYSGVQFIYEARGTISDLYSLYNRTKSNYTSMMQRYGQLVADGHMQPSEYLFVSSYLLGNITDMQKDLLEFINIFLDPEMRNISFSERWKRLKDIITKWEEITAKDASNIEQAEAQARKEAYDKKARVASLRRLLSALGDLEDMSEIQQDGDKGKPEAEPFIQDKAAMKAKLRSTLSVFSVDSIYGAVLTIILIITGILTPMALWLYFKGDGERHKDAILKLFVGLLISITIMGILWMILGDASLQFSGLANR